MVSEQLEGELCEDTLVLDRATDLEVAIVTCRTDGEDGLRIARRQAESGYRLGTFASAVERLGENFNLILEPRWQRHDDLFGLAIESPAAYLQQRVAIAEDKRVSFEIDRDLERIALVVGRSRRLQTCGPRNRAAGLRPARLRCCTCRSRPFET